MSQNLLPANTNIALGKPAEEAARKAKNQARKAEKDNYHYVRVAQNRVLTILQKGMEAGLSLQQLNTLPLWKIIGHALYGADPQPMKSEMDVRDARVPEKIWGDHIHAAKEAGATLHAVTYGRGVDKPKRNLRHLGNAYYGVIALGDDKVASVLDCCVVGVLLFDRFGNVAVSAGLPPLSQDKHRTDPDRPCSLTKNIRHAGVLQDIKYPDWAPAEYQDEFEAIFSRLTDGDQFNTFGV